MREGRRDGATYFETHARGRVRDGGGRPEVDGTLAALDGADVENADADADGGGGGGRASLSSTGLSPRWTAFLPSFSS